MPFDRTNDLWIVSRRNESYREGKLLDRVFFFLNHDPLCLESDPWNGEKVKMYMRGLASLGARKLDGRNSSYREDFRLSRLIGVKRKHTQPRFNRPAKLTR